MRPAATHMRPPGAWVERDGEGEGRHRAPRVIMLVRYPEIAGTVVQIAVVVPCDEVLRVDMHRGLEILRCQPLPVGAVEPSLGELHVKIGAIVERIDVAWMFREDGSPLQKLLDLRRISALEHALRRRPFRLPPWDLDRFRAGDSKTHHEEPRETPAPHAFHAGPRGRRGEKRTRSPSHEPPAS